MSSRSILHHACFAYFRSNSMHSNRWSKVLAATLLVCLPAADADAEVLPAAMFSDHMVLQRKIPVPVWGIAASGERVTVSLDNQAKTTIADPLGKWSLKLDPLQAGGPFVMRLQGNSNLVEFKDVFIGDVWVGSGQSNMANGVSGFAKNDPALARLAATTYPKLRLKRSGAVPWVEATPQSIEDFSAILFAFGAQLQQDLGVPVGLMVGAVGGTPAANWLSPEALASDAPCQAMIQNALARYDPVKAQHDFALKIAKWKNDLATARAKGEKLLPVKPQGPFKPGDCLTETTGCHYLAHIRPFIPYAIRGVLWDQGESGSAIQGVDQYTLMGALIRGWRAEWGQGDFPFIYLQKPSGGGCAWDLADPVTSQAGKFAMLPAETPNAVDGLWRETYIRIMQYPGTAMVTTTDLGSGVHPLNKSGYGARAARVAMGMVYGGKQEIYGPIYESATIEGSKIRVRFSHVGQGLTFRHGEKLQGFVLAGKDRKFHWADAMIEGDSVVVSCIDVPQPVAVRYAWASAAPWGSDSAWANLFNKDGLPALTFRNDAW